MIVSCESCKSRYKLDDSKITGRGAKITCPKCKHVFVVLAPPSAGAEAPRPAMLPQGAGGNEWEDEEPTRVGREANEAAAAAIAASKASPPVSPPPPPEPVSAPEHEIVRPRAAPAAAAPPPTREAVMARAAALDFRKVGVAAWKVKVRIGLVYDFSDIKTLRKYIQDGRVTPADVISYDGKSWKPIGEIPDLDGFFIESYEALERDYAGKATPDKSAQPAPADLGNVAAALAAAAAAEVEGKGRPEPTGPSYVDPFETMKKRQRERGPSKKGPEKEKKNNNLTYVAVVLVVLLLAGVAWRFLGGGGTPPVVEAPKPASKAAPTQVEEKTGPVFTPVEPRVVPTGVPAAQVDENCIKYINGKCVTGAVGPGPGGPGAPVQRPGGGGTPPGTPAPPAGGGATQATHDTDNMQIGDDFMRQGDFNSAVTAYTAAVSEGKAGASVKLGEAQWKAGDQAGGGSTLMSAASSNPKAWKVLGQLKEAGGDAAGAKDAYGNYLKSNPKDAAAIKARVEALGG